jgi:hypothetical protein
MTAEPTPTAAHIDAVARTMGVPEFMPVGFVLDMADHLLTTTDPDAQAALAANLPTSVMLAALVERGVLPDSTWAVYETRIGKVWMVNPPTQENAEREAGLCGPGHEAIPRHWAKAMANAWCHGRMDGIESMREATP